jgi:serine/threonine protein kinase
MHLKYRLTREAQIAKELHHLHLALFAGLFIEPETLDLYLASEYANGGLAREYIRNHRNSTVVESLVRVSYFSSVNRKFICYLRSSVV